MVHNLLFVPAITGPLFIIGGIIMRLFPPKRRNWLYGYRSTRSMQSQESWSFAQVYSAKEMLKLGTFLTTFSLTGLVINMDQGTAMTAGIIVMSASAFILFWRVEKALKNKFPDKQV